jgi:hypothetical protein
MRAACRSGICPARDHDWDLFEEFLFQDKDYEAYLTAENPALAGDLDRWFDPFNDVPTLAPDRGFRR